MKDRKKKKKKNTKTYFFDIVLVHGIQQETQRMSVILIAIVLTKVFLYHKRRMIWVVFVGGVAVAAYLTYPMTKRLLRIPKWTVQRPENNQDGVDTSEPLLL